MAPGLALHAIFPSRRQLAPKVRAFLEVLTHGTARPWDEAPSER